MAPAPYLPLRPISSAIRATYMVAAREFTRPDRGFEDSSRYLFTAAADAWAFRLYLVQLLAAPEAPPNMIVPAVGTMK